MPVQTQLQQRRGTAASWTSTNPTLAAGEIGFESDTGKIKIGTGSTAWNALAYTASSTAVTYLFNATAAQTTFSGTDANGLTLAYTVGAEQVYLNGALQVRGSDYTATNGTSIVLTSGALVNDVLNVIAYSAMSVADTYTQAQANALFIPDAIVDAKGDLIAATASDTVARLAVGSNGAVLQADSSTATGLSWAGPLFVAGKNKLINGDFGVWQRGTTFTSPATNSYTADRWVTNQDGSGTVTVSQQSFTAGTAPVAGYESPFFLRQAVTAAGTTTFFQMSQKIEDVRTFANQTVTFSFWAKADSSRSGLVYWEQNFGSGGSATVQSSVFPAPALTTSWQRFTYTFTLPSISGKTIGTGSCLIFYIRNGGTVSGANLDIWGAQLEAGSVATPFQTATGTVQGELAACQRYYWRMATGAANPLGNGSAYSSSHVQLIVQFPVTMRVGPALDMGTGTDYFTFVRNGGSDTFNSFTIDSPSTIATNIYNSTQISSTAGNGGVIFTNNASAYLGFTSEL